MWSESTVSFADQDGKTEMKCETDCAGKGIVGKAMLALISGQVKKRQVQDFNRFTAMVEGRLAEEAAS